MFALIPLGGSEVIFTDLCNKDTGNFSCGFEDIKILKSLGILPAFLIASISDSTTGRIEIDK